MPPSTSPEPLTVDLGEGATTTALVYEPQALPTGASLIFAHGAGAGQRSSFIVAFAQALAARGVSVVTFNFLYTERARRLPDRGPLLEQCYRAVIRAVAARRANGPPPEIFIGGKSMGGRIATQVAAADPTLPIAGIVSLGYPLHPPGKPEQRRDRHLPHLVHRLLVVQGSLDAFGTPDELGTALATMPRQPTLHVVERGDHSFKVARIGAEAQGRLVEHIYDVVVDWIRGSALGVNG